MFIYSRSYDRISFVFSKSKELNLKVSFLSGFEFDGVYWFYTTLTPYAIVKLITKHTPKVLNSCFVSDTIPSNDI